MIVLPRCGIIVKSGQKSCSWLCLSFLLNSHLLPSLPSLDMDNKHPSHLSHYKRTNLPSTSTPSKLLRSGSANLRERSTFGGTSWKPKRLELDTEFLTVVNVSHPSRPHRRSYCLFFFLTPRFLSDRLEEAHPHQTAGHHPARTH